MQKEKKHKLNYWLLKLNRISCIVLIAATVLFIISGYSMTNSYGIRNLISRALAVKLHVGLSIIFTMLFVLHSGLSIYFAVRRKSLGKPLLSLRVLNRVAAWLLFGFILTNISTGFSMIGKFGLDFIISLNQARAIHRFTDIPVIILFLIHTLLSLYLFFGLKTKLRRS